MKKLLIFFCTLFITGLLACDFSFKGKPVDVEKPGSETWETMRPLHDIYKNDFLIGNIISPGDLTNTTRNNLLRRHFNTVTAENHMKPDFIAPISKPAAGAAWNYRFSAADSIVNAANAAGMKVVGHTLVWHSQTPAWMTEGNRITVLANFEKYVTDVVTHFKGRLMEWDVVNEAFRDGLTNTDANTNWRTCLRFNDSPGQPGSGSRWNSVIGNDYIERAFLLAREADPDVKLFYNDYNLNNANKARAVFNMVKDINERFPNVGGRPLIDGIGMQSHHHINTDPQSVENSIILFSSLGVDVAITELDILAAGTLLQNNPPWNEAAAQKQAEQYAAMFRIFLKHASKISRVTFWGLDDGTHWRASTGGHAVLLDKDYNLKPAFFAITDPYRF